MFNLSDKELDRLSREAASQHDPGDPLGPGAWDRLELRLDKELGRVTPAPRPVRGIRRLPFQYAPVLILVVGVSYFFVKQFGKTRKSETAGSPPLTVVKPLQTDSATDTNSSNKTPDNRENFTLESTRQPGTPITPVNTDPLKTDPSTGRPASPGTPTNGSGSPLTGASPLTGSSTGTGLTTPNTAPAGAGAAPAPAKTPGSTSSYTRPNSLAANTGLSTSTHQNARDWSKAGKYTGHTGSLKGPGRGHHETPTGNNPSSGALSNEDMTNGLTTDSKADGLASGAKGQGSLTDAKGQGSNAPRSPTYTKVTGPHSLAGSFRINDSALRAYKHLTAAATPVTPGKPGGNSRSNHINRDFQFGLKIAPDFASVNSLAGDKPGSSVGLTFDYIVANRLYLGTGLLYSRKNYTARIQDCHLPPDYVNRFDLRHVDFVKGRLNTLEIPLNIRYDVSVTGNTMIFASGGLSSYILLGQQSDYYMNLFGREAYKRFNYSDKQAYIFSSVNLSFGVETGISNNLSLLLAPYVKLPTSSMGFGDIKINSIGIDFALKFSPVSSRKRK